MAEQVESAEFAVTGMTCHSCAALIEESLVDDPRIRAVAVDLDAARAVVTFDATRTSPAEVGAAIEELGYGASLASA